MELFVTMTEVKFLRVFNRQLQMQFVAGGPEAHRLD